MNFFHDYFPESCLFNSQVTVLIGNCEMGNFRGRVIMNLADILEIDVYSKCNLDIACS